MAPPETDPGGAIPCVVWNMGDSARDQLFRPSAIWGWDLVKLFPSGGYGLPVVVSVTSTFSN